MTSEIYERILQISKKHKFMRRVYYNLKLLILIIRKSLGLFKEAEERDDPESLKWRRDPWYKVFEDRINYACRFVQDKVVFAEIPT